MTLAATSDVELLFKARSGDDSAVDALLGRHGHAASRLAGDLGAGVTPDEVRATATEALHSGLPFRAAMLAQRIHGAAPIQDASPDREVWAAYSSLPTAWRLAVWHREVEGHRLGKIAGYLGMTERETSRALASAYTALKRFVAVAHPEGGTSAECFRLSEIYGNHPPTFLDRLHTRDLREHGRHCDDCMPLIRDLFIVDHDLRSVLAEIVLGAAASDYLKTRSTPVRLRVVNRASENRPLVPDSRLRPVLGVLGGTAVAAAAVALIVVNPHRTQGPDETYAAPAPVVYSHLAGSTLHQLGAPGLATAAVDTLPTRTPSVAGGHQAVQVVHQPPTHVHLPGGQPSGGGHVAPPVSAPSGSYTSDPSTPSTPSQPSGGDTDGGHGGGGNSGGGNSGGSGTPTTPTTHTPVSVSHSGSGTDVTVDPGAGAPVTVHVPVVVPPVHVTVPVVHVPVVVPPVHVAVPPVSLPGGSPISVPGTGTGLGGGL